MSNCPEQDCFQRTNDVHEAMFSKGGVKDCVQEIKRKKIPWTALMWIVPIFVTIMGITGSLIYRAHSAGQAVQDKAIEKVEVDVKADHDLMLKINTTQGIIVEKVKAIEGKVEEGTRDRKEILRELRKLKRTSIPPYGNPNND